MYCQCCIFNPFKFTFRVRLVFIECYSQQVEVSVHQVIKMYFLSSLQIDKYLYLYERIQLFMKGKIISIQLFDIFFIINTSRRTQLLIIYYYLLPLGQQLDQQTINKLSNYILKQTTLFRDLLQQHPNYYLTCFAFINPMVATIRFINQDICAQGNAQNGLFMGLFISGLSREELRYNGQRFGYRQHQLRDQISFNRPRNRLFRMMYNDYDDEIEAIENQWHFPTRQGRSGAPIMYSRTHSRQGNSGSSFLRDRSHHNWIEMFNTIERSFWGLEKKGFKNRRNRNNQVYYYPSFQSFPQWQQIPSTTSIDLQEAYKEMKEVNFNIKKAHGHTIKAFKKEDEEHRCTKGAVLTQPQRYSQIKEMYLAFGVRNTWRKLKYRLNREQCSYEFDQNYVSFFLRKGRYRSMDKLTCESQLWIATSCNNISGSVEYIMRANIGQRAYELNK